jgi:CxxC motif-containing protein
MKELICIVCPKGCHLKVDDNLNVTGNACARGVKYGIDELTNPTRMVTTTVVIVNGEIPRLPVVTSAPIPKDKIMDVMNEINKLIVEAPIYVKDIVISNVLDLGVDIVATRDVNKK